MNAPEQQPNTQPVDPKFERPVWYLASPFYQYAEDVKAVARKHGLRIIDANVTADRSNACGDPPKVTIKPEYAPVDKAKIAAAQIAAIEQAEAKRAAEAEAEAKRAAKAK